MVSFTKEFNNGNLTIFLLCFGTNKENKAILTKNRKLSPGPEKPPKWLVLQQEFNNGILTIFLLFFGKRKENKAVLNRYDKNTFFCPGQKPIMF